MNGDQGTTAYEQAFEEVERFGRALAASEREESMGLEEMLQLEYGDDDAVLHALGEEDGIGTEPFAWTRPAAARKGRRREP